MATRAGCEHALLVNAPNGWDAGVILAEMPGPMA